MPLSAFEKLTLQKEIDSVLEDIPSLIQRARAGTLKAAEVQNETDFMLGYTVANLLTMSAVAISDPTNEEAHTEAKLMIYGRAREIRSAINNYIEKSARI